MLISINRGLQRIETLIDSIPAILLQAPDLVKAGKDVPTISLADAGGVEYVKIEGHLGNPSIKRDATLFPKRIHLTRNSYIDLKDESLAQYVEVYLKGIDVQTSLKGLTKPDILRLVKVPKSPEDIAAILRVNEGLRSNKTELEKQRDLNDEEIDQNVYHVYGLTEEEISIVEQH